MAAVGQRPGPRLLVAGTHKIYITIQRKDDISQTWKMSSFTWFFYCLGYVGVCDPDRDGEESGGEVHQVEIYRFMN